MATQSNTHTTTSGTTASMTPSIYVLHTGEEDIERLELLNSIYNPSTTRLLEAARLKSGDVVADMGCGHGQVTAILAQMVGPTGTVLALDAASDQLEVARQTCKDFNNVSYYVANVMDSAVCAAIQPGSLDAIYCRFFLMHVSDPFQALQNMLALLKPGGKLIIEEAQPRSQRFVPSDESKDPRIKYWEFVKKIQPNADVAVSLYPMLKQLPVNVVSYTFSQPIGCTKEEKRYPYLSTKKLWNIFVEKCGVSWDELDVVLKMYETYINDDKVYLEHSKIHQFIVTKS